jgi:chaperone modulatory protein CbpM
MTQILVSCLTLEELCRFCRAERTAIVALVDFGVLIPEGTSEADWTFDARAIKRTVQACRLERDLGLNIPGIALVLDLLDERTALRVLVQDLSAR